jgi:hypothetical protein
MSLPLVIVLAIAVLLGAHLFLRGVEWMCVHVRRGSALSHAFDATSARDRLARVRRNPLAAVGARPAGRGRRRRLQAQVCRSVRHHAYFRRDVNAGLNVAESGRESPRL